MKRKILLSILPLTGLISMAQDNPGIKVIENMTTYEISPNGQWIRAAKGGSIIYNTITGETINIGNIEKGTGNCISNSGAVVGSANGGTGKIFINGKEDTPETLLDYWFCYPCAITPDDTRMVGTINNTTSGAWYVPFYCDIAEDGTVGEPVVITYPTKDLLDANISYATAVWVSEDGKTILGAVADNIGQYFYPIIYTQDEKGDWSYSLPTKDLFNPNKIELPENPWATEPPYPTPEDYMSKNALEKYNEQLLAASMGEAPYPDPVDFMSEEEIEEYNEAAKAYNEWAESLSSEIKKYEDVYFKILDDSYQFPLNDFTLSGDGKTFAATALKINIISETEYEENYYIYVYDIEKEEGRFIESLNWVLPQQILPDGTIIANYPLVNTYSEKSRSSFIIEPGGSELIPFKEYCDAYYPGIANWIEENLVDGSGCISMSNDKSVIVGCYDVFNLGVPDPDPDILDYTYIFYDGDMGVDNIITNETGIFKVYNLQGLNVLTTKDSSKIKELPEGIYIINGKKYHLSH